jgi:hypothetical protein
MWLSLGGYLGWDRYQRFLRESAMACEKVGYSRTLQATSAWGFAEAAEALTGSSFLHRCIVSLSGPAKMQLHIANPPPPRSLHLQHFNRSPPELQ